ncbi:hypothetical protein FKW77_009102 [Venturia effusa]|uniref:Uncharacterized protein n=1 Tax=Venturia effusa TaxID=50376 RepID=A0A517LG54_9PEZI|nr:hypothetical protein FKW77_009102 [Venturia effusa]
MRRLLDKLPHRRRDAASDERHSSQPDGPINATSLSPPTSSVVSDANHNDRTDPARIASNGRPDATASCDDSTSARHSQSTYGASHKRPFQQSKDDALNKQPSRHSRDDAHRNRDSLSDESEERQNALTPPNQPIDGGSVSKSDTNKLTALALDHGLQLEPQDTSLYEDLSYLALAHDSREAAVPIEKKCSEDSVNRNVMLNDKEVLRENTAGRRGSILRTPVQVDEFSEDIADRNLDPPVRSNSKRALMTSTPSSPIDSLDQFDSPGLLASDRGVLPAPGNLEDLRRIQRVGQDKPSTGAPKTDFKDFDFNNSEDVDFYTQYAPAVTHETVIPEIHHVEHEVLTREIHNYDIYHRILPIKDIEVLPAKHFVRDPVTGELTQIPAPPGREVENHQWKIVAAKSDSGWQPSAPRQFTARTFKDDEGMPREYVGRDGILHTEVTWVHPPTIQDGGYETGQTEALFMNAFDDQNSTGKRDLSHEQPGGIHEFDSRFCDDCYDESILEKKSAQTSRNSDSRALAS